VRIDASPVIEGRPISVLVAEDDPVNRMLARKELARLGVAPTVVPDAETGLDLARHVRRLGIDDTMLVGMTPELRGWPRWPRSTPRGANSGPWWRPPGSP
jgi:DNA-binding response OmpR family regulator